MSTQQDIHAFAERFMAALNGTDAAAVRSFYTPDATCWHNFDDYDQPIDENMKLFEWMARKAPGRRYQVVRRDLLPGGWFQQHVLEADLPDGRRLRMLACCVITLENGLIRRIEEYLDPAQAAVLSSKASA
jgi:ketosteroid isomerase-like protein